MERLKSEPEQVVADLQELRTACVSEQLTVDSASKYTDLRPAVTSASGMRIAITGDILSMPQPVSVWKENFGEIPVGAASQPPVLWLTRNL